MEKLYKIKEALMRELDQSKTARNGELQAGELEAIHKLTDTIKNIDKICMLAEQSDYSHAGGSSYGRGSSYANRGQHYVRGHYSRDGGSSYDGGSDGGYSSRRGGGSNRGGSRGGSRGGYSRDGGYSRGEGTEEMMEYVRMAIDSAPEEYKEDIRHFMHELENA